MAEAKAGVVLSRDEVVVVRSALAQLRASALRAVARERLEGVIALRRAEVRTIENLLIRLGQDQSSVG